ncbi:MAG: Smr/MutS family protein [Candidatus Ozemobacteraceae bacterium]
MSNEIDLHGCQVIEALDTFVSYYNSRIRDGDFNRILVIHGYGSTGEGGRIRVQLRRFLSNHLEYLAFACGEDIGFSNLGNTFVFPRKPLPSAMDALSSKILEYCESPKTKSKISGKFRMHGDTKVQASLQNLEKQKLLRIAYKGGTKLYQATTCSLLTDSPP